MSMQIPCPDYVYAVLNALHASGHEAYIVGGCVRDCMLGNTPKDWDVTTSALPEQTEAAALAAGLKTFRTGIKHGTISVLSDGVTVECTTYRVDGDYKDSRHPESVRFTPSLTEDLARRDFTINAMAATPREEGWEIIDPFDGRADLNAGIIRCVGNPIKRFGEDALRILRGVRFATRLGFTIEEKTANAMYASAGGLKNISRERVREELMGILQSSDPETAVKIMKKRGFLKYVFPYADVTASAKGVNTLPADAPLLRLAYLLYDASDEAVHATTNDLKMSGADARLVRILLTLRGERLDNTPLFAREMIALYGDYALPALSLRAYRGEDTSALAQTVQQQLDRGVCVKVADLAVNGADLAAIGIPKGREMGNVLNALLAEVMKDPDLNTKDALLALAKQIYKEH
ncbi:MAG: polynucleotide adenylyltransferase [Clostridia bacterium]|nr:polynucleotide adenylyltransferase [Clostridia bacterium]